MLHWTFIPPSSNAFWSYIRGCNYVDPNSHLDWFCSHRNHSMLLFSKLLERWQPVKLKCPSVICCYFLLAFYDNTQTWIVIKWCQKFKNVILFELQMKSDFVTYWTRNIKFTEKWNIISSKALSLIKRLFTGKK